LKSLKISIAALPQAHFKNFAQKHMRENSSFCFKTTIISLLLMISAVTKIT